MPRPTRTHASEKPSCRPGCIATTGIGPIQVSMVRHPSLISPAVTRSIPSTCHLYDLLLHEQCPICVNEAPLRGLGIAAHAAASEG